MWIVEKGEQGEEQTLYLGLIHTSCYKLNKLVSHEMTNLVNIYYVLKHNVNPSLQYPTKETSLQSHTYVSFESANHIVYVLRFPIAFLCIIIK